VSSFFAYGTLSIPVVMAELTGRALEDVPASVAGYARRRMRGRAYPAAVPDPAGVIEGRLYHGLDAATLARIDRFEGRQYERKRVEALVGGDRVPADLYVLREAYRATAVDEPWDREAFVRDHLTDFLRMCASFRADEEARADPDRR
jgi:gamma-glutamylcyclotransferase (GGCT)/AIG2-like uncharacterized protein YtfP